MTYEELTNLIFEKRDEWQNAKTELYNGNYEGDVVERSNYISQLGEEITGLLEELSQMPQPEVVLPVIEDSEPS